MRGGEKEDKPVAYKNGIADMKPASDILIALGVRYSNVTPHQTPRQPRPFDKTLRLGPTPGRGQTHQRASRNVQRQSKLEKFVALIQRKVKNPRWPHMSMSFFITKICLQSAQQPRGLLGFSFYRHTG